jgi:hypothetical protein
MAKRYSVTPTKRLGKQSYSTSFRDATGKRVTRGLGTQNKDAADTTCIWLRRLWTDKVRSQADVPPGCPIAARDLYFGVQRAPPASPAPVSTEELRRMPVAARSHVIQIAGELHQAREELARQAAQIKALEEVCATETGKHQALARSILGQAASAGARSPALEEALVEFERHLAATTTPGYRRDVMSLATDFTASLPEKCKTLADVSVEQIAAFLDAKAVASHPAQPLTRYTRYRIKLGRLINWAAQRWGYPSQMSGVRSLSATQVGRERTEIHWHELAEIEALIQSLDTYWQALVGTLAYAGLQLAEMCWLRHEDLIWGPDRKTAQLRIATVIEGAGSEARHFLKSSHRRRMVTVHPRLLLPRLKAHSERMPEGGLYLFPMPADRARRRRRLTPGSADRWCVHSLSVILRGHQGGKHRAPSKGILPAGMNAKSLRRTFGSLLIRSGATEAQVAAAMGNTPSVVRAHYARILGREVDVDF